jgi:hypothetical protein
VGRFGGEGLGVTTPLREQGVFAASDCDLSRPVFTDPRLQEEFDRRGYVVVDLLDPTEVAALSTTYRRAAEGDRGVNPPGAYNDTYAEFSFVHSWPDFRRQAFDHITELVGPRADALLVDHRPLLANFVNKPPGTGVVPAHQNLSVVDESRYQSVSVWVALVDCVVDNGAMLLGDRTNRGLRGRRGMWSYEVFGGVQDALVEEFLRPVVAEAGQAVILDDAVIHCSPPNRTAEQRLAIQLVMVPAEADALFFQQVGTEGDALAVDVWQIEEGFFFDFWDGMGDRSFAEAVTRIEVPVPHFDVPTLRALIPAA